MSKLDAQRAMREANYAARNKGQAHDQSRGGTPARGTDVLGLAGTARSRLLRARPHLRAQVDERSRLHPRGGALGEVAPLQLRVAGVSGLRSARRRTNFRPDHTSSIAHTLTSTKPAARPISRTTFSSMSVGTFDAFLGQQTQIIPACSVRSISCGSRFSSFARARCGRSG